MNVDLPEEMWRNILTLLAETPYKVSAPLIHGISRQLQEQANKSNGVGEPLQDMRPGA